MENKTNFFEKRVSESSLASVKTDSDSNNDITFDANFNSFYNV